MEEVQEVWSWKNSIVWTIGSTDNPTTVSTADKKITVKLTEYDVTDATSILANVVADTDGAAAGTNIDVTLLLERTGIGAGFWIVEAIADIDEANPITVIPRTEETWPYLVEIRVEESMPDE